jgi:hypothetical protein
MKAMILLPLLALGLLCTTGAAGSPGCGGSEDPMTTSYKTDISKEWLSPSNYKSFSSQANFLQDYCPPERAYSTRSSPVSYYYTYQYPASRYYTWYYYPYSYYKYPPGYFYDRDSYSLVIG